MKPSGSIGLERERKGPPHALSPRAQTPPEDDRPANKHDINQLRTELIEAMRDMQTEVLRGFHSWARPIEIRLRSFDDMQQRLGLLEERVSNIERGKSSN